PLVVQWGGIDSFKEERRAEPFLARGVASLAIDMPGVGESPVSGSPDAERLWDAIFDWIPGRLELDAARVAVYGASTGGYWAAKLAHTHRERIRCAVDHGGPPTTPSSPSGSRRRRMVSTRSSWPRRWPERLAVSPMTTGSSSRRNFHCSTRACSI